MRLVLILIFIFRIIIPLVRDDILILFLLFRAIWPVVIPLACAVITILLTLGVMALSGRSLNMVSSVLPSLLWVLSLAGSIHLIRSYQWHSTRKKPDEAIALALQDVVRPCCVAAITTGQGRIRTGCSATDLPRAGLHLLLPHLPNTPTHIARTGWAPVH